MKLLSPASLSSVSDAFLSGFFGPFEQLAAPQCTCSLGHSLGLRPLLLAVQALFLLGKHSIALQLMDSETGTMPASYGRAFDFQFDTQPTTATSAPSKRHRARPPQPDLLPNSPNVHQHPSLHLLVGHFLFIFLTFFNSHC